MSLSVTPQFSTNSYSSPNVYKDFEGNSHEHHSSTFFGTILCDDCGIREARRLEIPCWCGFPEEIAWMHRPQPVPGTTTVSTYVDVAVVSLRGVQRAILNMENKVMLDALDCSDWMAIFEYIKNYTRDDVTEIFAHTNGELEGPSWLGIFKLKDDQYMSVRASCPYYTGWEIGGTVESELHSSVENAWFCGLTESERKRLYPCVAEIVDEFTRNLGDRFSTLAALF